MAAGIATAETTPQPRNPLVSHKRRTRNIVRLTIFYQINSRSWFVKPLHEGCRTRRPKTTKNRTRTTVVWYVAFFSVLIDLCRKTTRTVRRRTIDEASYAPKVPIRRTITLDIIVRRQRRKALKPARLSPIRTGHDKNYRTSSKRVFRINLRRHTRTTDSNG